MSKRRGNSSLRFAVARAITVARNEYEAFHVTGELSLGQRRFESIAVPGAGVAKFETAPRR